MEPNPMYNSAAVANPTVLTGNRRVDRIILFSKHQTLLSPVFDLDALNTSTTLLNSCYGELHFRLLSWHSDYHVV